MIVDWALEAPAVMASLDDVAVVGQAIENSAVAIDGVWRLGRSPHQQRETRHIGEVIRVERDQGRAVH